MPTWILRTGRTAVADVLGAARGAVEGLARWVLVRPPTAVPVVVDALRDVDGVKMARCTYFVVVSDVPRPDWAIKPDGNVPALHMLGTTGILYGPSPQEPVFSSPDVLEQVFATVDQLAGLSIEFEDVWIPREWFASDCEPRSVYRVGLAQFQAAYRYREDETSLEAFLGIDGAGAVTYSPEETNAYQGWGLLQIEEAISLYREKGPELKLADRELPEEWT